MCPNGSIEEFFIFRKWLLNYLKQKCLDVCTLYQTVKEKRERGRENVAKCLKVVNLSEGYIDFHCTFFKLVYKFDIFRKMEENKAYIIKMGKVCNVK